MNSFRKIISGLSVILLMAGCTDSLFFSKYVTVNSAEWQSRDTLVYRLPDVEYVSRYDMMVAVRTAQNYAYDNFALVVRLYEGKRLMSTDTVSYRIYDEDGENRGKGFPFVEHETVLPHAVTLTPKKKYVVKIAHIMRLDPIPDICDVGISLLPF